MRAFYLFASVAGPILTVAGMAGMFGFGIPDPYWLFAALPGSCLVWYSLIEAKKLQQRGIQTGFVESTSSQQKWRPWLFLVIAIVAGVVFYHYFAGHAAQP